MKIVLPDYTDISETDKARIRDLGEVTLYEDIPASEDEVIQRIAGAKLITASWIDVSEAVIQSNPQLKYIVVPAVGYDQIDVLAATNAGIQVINCPTHNAQAVAEYTLGLIFAVTRKVFEASISLRKGHWNPGLYQGIELKGKHLCLIGYGTIGQEVAKLAIALGMQVSWSTSQTSSAELDQLIASADILSLHLPLTKQSKHLLNQQRLSLMKPSAYLVNTARGAIADSKALFNALKQKQIAGAALDVFEGEPITGGPSPEILELVQLDNVLATPHIAYNTEETAIRLGAELINNIRTCIQGSPVNVIN